MNLVFSELTFVEIASQVVSYREAIHLNRLKNEKILCREGEIMGMI